MKTEAKISKEAADILSTDCAHVWRNLDHATQGMGTVIFDAIKQERPNLWVGTDNIAILDGAVSVQAKIHDFDGLRVIEVTSAEYLPKNGVKTIKLISFGKKGISYFLNSHESQGKPAAYTLTVCLYPSEEKKTIPVSEHDALPIPLLNNTAGMTVCQKLLDNHSEAHYKV